MAAAAWLKDNISHTVAAIKITMLLRVYINMVTARLLTKGSNTTQIHTDARENITRTRAKRKAGYFFMAHSLYIFIPATCSYMPVPSGDCAFCVLYILEFF